MNIHDYGSYFLIEIEGFDTQNRNYVIEQQLLIPRIKETSLASIGPIIEELKIKADCGGNANPCSKEVIISHLDNGNKETVLAYYYSSKDPKKSPVYISYEKQTI